MNPPVQSSGVAANNVYQPCISVMSVSEVPQLDANVLKACHRTRPRLNLIRIASFVAIFLSSVVVTIYVANQINNGLLCLFLLAFYLISAASLHGISLFTHEAVHGTLARNRLTNDLLGAACAMPVLQTCRAYRVLHLKHHKHLGDSGDPDHYENYTRWTWMVFFMNWLRLLIGYPVYICAIPVLGFRQGTRADRICITAEVLVLILLITSVCLSPMPRQWLVHGWLIPLLLINTMVNIRGMSQHTLLEHATDQIKGTRTILTSAVVRFFMCNENYHLEHHLYPGVPWHALPEVHAALKPELISRGAPYISSYAAFVLEFLHHSIQRSPLGRRKSARPVQDG